MCVCACIFLCACVCLCVYVLVCSDNNWGRSFKFESGHMEGIRGMGHKDWNKKREGKWCNYILVKMCLLFVKYLLNI